MNTTVEPGEANDAKPLVAVPDDGRVDAAGEQLARQLRSGPGHRACALRPSEASSAATACLAAPEGTGA
jgi:hypothetical protein